MCPLGYSAVNYFLRLRYSALSTHTYMHARTTASIHTARATLSGVTLSLGKPNDSGTKKRGILYNSS